MSAHLNRRPDYDWDFVAQESSEKSPKYQQFSELNSHQARLEELLFFGQLALFCVLTVLFSFLFLSFSWPALLALPAGAGLSLLASYSAKELLNTRLNQMNN